MNFSAWPARLLLAVAALPAASPGRFEAVNVTLNDILLSMSGFSGKVQGGLAFHREAKEASGLVLGVGKKPPNLDPSKDDEETMIRSGDRRQVIFQSVSMGRLANYLGQIWHITVVDHTGIKGKFDFSLDPDSFSIEPSAQSSLRRESFGDLVRDA